MKNAKSSEPANPKGSKTTYLLQEKRGVTFETIATIAELSSGETLETANKALEACRPIRRVIAKVEPEENACAMVVDRIVEIATRLAGEVDRRPDYANAPLEFKLYSLATRLSRILEEVEGV